MVSKIDLNISAKKNWKVFTSVCSIAINLSREQSLVFTRLLGVQFWLFGCIPIDINPQYLALSDNFISDDNSVSSQIHIKTTWSESTN